MMKIKTGFTVAAAAFLFGCGNHVQKVLRDPKMYAEVRDSVIMRGECVNDSVWVYIPGRTDSIPYPVPIVKKEVDTAVINKAIRENDETCIEGLQQSYAAGYNAAIDDLGRKKFAQKTPDVYKAAVRDTKREALLEAALSKLEAYLKSTEQDRDRFKSARNSWRFKFWFLVVLALIIIFRKQLMGSAGVALSLLKKTIMRSIALILCTSLFFASCIAPNKNETKVEERQSLMRTEKAANGALLYNDMDWETVLVDTTGDYHIKGFNEKGQGAWLTVTDTTWKKEKKIPRSTFLLTMSRKMVKQFMGLSDYFTEAFLWALILSLIVAAAVYKFFKDDLVRLMGKGAVGVYFIVAIAIPFRMFQKRPSELADLNVKQLSRAEFDAWKAKDPTLEKFWLEQWEQNRLVSLTNKNVVK